jgi:uncharacterized damage-inducible protein DinB
MQMTATRRWPALAIGLVGLACATPTLSAQSAATDYRDEFLSHFGRSSMKMTRLADAMPESAYTWSPGEGVMSVARVYMHIARYNYLYLDGSLGISAPDGVDWQNFESVSDKASIEAALAQSIEHVERHVSAMSEDDLTRMTTLYGREVPGWAVLFQLLSHMNEHVGQSIAYARMNGVVPPWSR